MKTLFKNTMPFWLRLLVYLLPFALGFFALTGWLVYIGESMPLGIVLQQQDSAELVLYRPRYGNRDRAYKLAAVNSHQADILALGSSRILQFRQEFFNLQPNEFYNASAPAWRLEQVYELLTQTNSDALPKIILLGIDPPWFVESYQGDVFPAPVSDFSQFFIVNRSFIREWLANPQQFERANFTFSQYSQRLEPHTGGNLALGMRAIRDGHGFRNDGSEQFGDYLVAQWLWQPQQRERHLALMQNGEDVYPYGDTVWEGRVTQMRQVLDFAQKHEILVIGFMPSYTPTLWEAMLQTGKHDYVPLVTEEMQTLFAEYDYPFFDYSNGAAVGATDEDFFDGWHASERANLQLYVDILKQVPELQAYSDITELERIIREATSTWYVFEN